MNLKNKFKKFFTLRPGAEDGFTLVELVVVIAILGILSAVAVPSLNKYITAAKNAKDKAILGAVSTAFAAACVDARFDVENVTAASIKVENQAVYGLSTLSVAEGVSADIATVANSFHTLYVESNTGTTFSTPNVNSLVWNPATQLFELSSNQTSTLVVLSSGKVLSISPEDMALIQASAYSDMGYTEVADIISNLTDSSEGLVALAKKLSLGDKFAAVLLHNGLVDSADEANALDAEDTANGLTLVTAKYLSSASEDEIAALLDVDVGGSLGTTTGMLQNIADGTGGTVSVSAAALQYALVQAYANSTYSDGETIKIGKGESVLLGGGYKEHNFSSISDFLASDLAKSDPIWAMNKVQGTDAYSSYASEDNTQYQSDIDGFVGTMSVLGENTGTVSNPGAIDINSFLTDGVESQDAKDALTQILGK